MINDILKTNVAGVAGVTLSKFKKIKAKQRRFLLNTLGDAGGFGLTPTKTLSVHKSSCEKNMNELVVVGNSELSKEQIREDLAARVARAAALRWDFHSGQE